MILQDGGPAEATVAPCDDRAAASPLAGPAPFRVDLVAAAFCTLVGLVLAVEPHLAMLARYGTLEYLADGDDVLYVAVGRIPYWGEPWLRDPFRGYWQPAPTLYAWLQFAPFSILTRWLGLGPELMPLVWRSVGGPLLGLTLYLLFRRLFARARHPAAWSLACALICLADPGFIHGRSLVQGAWLVRAMVGGEMPVKVPHALGQFRVVTPLLVLPPLLALLAVMVPGGRRNLTAWIFGAVMLGLSVRLYFFIWTAAVAGLTAYLAGLLALWAFGRSESAFARREFRFGAAVVFAGLAIGAPQIVNNSQSFANPEIKPILQRISRGQVIPPDSPARSRHLKNNWAYAKLGFGLAVIVGIGAWQLTPVWATAAAGFALANSAMITGLEFENFHWNYVFGPLGEIVLLAGLVLIWERLRWPARLGLSAVGVVAAALLALAVLWRPFEALSNPEAVVTNRALRSLVPIRGGLAKLTPDDVLAGPWETNLSLLSGSAGQLYQFDQSSHSSVITDREVHERHALNGWLCGLSREAYEATTAAKPFPGGEVTDPSWTPGAVTAARMRIFDDLEAGRPEALALLEAYRPNSLLRRASDGPPPRGGPWELAASGGDWALWSRLPARPGPHAATTHHRPEYGSIRP
jgi:hypothetical protein